ncbi:tripartite tricarboxylate transporter permease [Paenalcaligenes niemegkensis]|uniref:tripartite tricarboxylate transporter permease n=1 Tax=Paenalcaligenes niemegkensis TaxID=2895469 RepID=UPI001EE885FC|nr:tripartite tricarboxylate transporter permease [Paenalcaligenes niemegkensis]MCQ9618288.1 tripartite tricarboxylate transporter permease [Paenalcaligenes niemegkensis]
MLDFINALDQVFSIPVLATILGASLFGLFMGAIPGLTSTMATALLVPLTFFMGPVQAISAIVAATVMTIFAGDIPSALLRIPGTPASAAYTDDAYLIAQKGRAGQILGLNLLCSVIGGIIAVLVISQFAPALARVSLSFTSDEYFWLALLGLSSAVLVARGKPLKGCISLGLGLLFAMVGIDSVMGMPRLTFGNMDLAAGIAILPTMVGIFAVAELLRKIPTLSGPQAVTTPLKPGAVFKGTGKLIKEHKGSIAGGTTVGTIVGILPGAGADIAAWVAYAISKRFSKTPEKYGTGHTEGIIAASASNNASLTGTYVPALVFGIPGDTVTAIVIGVLLMKGITPGPMVFTTEGPLVYSIYIVFVLANLLMIPLGWVAIRCAGKVLSVPSSVLYPLILIFCIVGAYSANNSLFDVGIMMGMGVLAYFLEKNEFPTAPLILALILGPIIEENFMKSLIKANGDLWMFFDRPTAMWLGFATLLIWALLIFGGSLRKLIRKKVVLASA